MSEASRPERISLRYDPAYGLFGVVALVSIVAPILLYGSVHLECARSAAGETAQCTGGTGWLDAAELRAFPLEPGVIRLDWSEHSSKGKRSALLLTPGGTLSGRAIDRQFAERVIRETNTFREQSTSLAWSASEANTIPPIFAFLFGCLMFVGFAWQRRPRTFVIDRGLGMLSASFDAWQLKHIERVEVRDLRSGPTLTIHVHGRVIDLGTGSKTSAEAAAAVIRAAKNDPPAAA